MDQFIAVLYFLFSPIWLFIRRNLRIDTYLGNSDTVVVPQTATLEQPRRTIFVGRDKELGVLHHALKPKLTLEPRSCALQGLGGCGKTNLASEYWYVHGPDYKHMWWIPSEDIALIEQKFGQIAIDLDPTRIAKHQRENIQITLDWLSTTEEIWLLVFDNAISQKDLSGFIPREGCGSIIITTQYSELALALAHKLISITSLKSSNGARLLGRFLEPRKEDLKKLSRLSDLADNLPLALEHVAGSIGSMTLDEYMEILSNAPPADKSYQRIFDIALRELTEEGRKILDCMCFISPDTIPEDVLLRIDATFLLSNTPHLQKPEIVPLLKVLESRHLIYRASQRSKPGAMSSFSMHRLLKQALLRNLNKSPERRDQTFEQVTHLLRTAIPRQSSISSPTHHHHGRIWDEYLPHVLALHTAYDESLTTRPSIKGSVAFVELLSDAGNYMWESSQLDHALSVLRTASSLCAELPQTDELNKLRYQTLYIQATFETNAGSVSRAEGMKHQEMVLAWRRRRAEKIPLDNVEDALQLATAYNNVACTYMHADQWEKAEALLKEAFKLKNSWSTEEKNPDHFAEAYKNEALVELSKGNSAEALELINKSCNLMVTWAGHHSLSAQGHKFLRACILFNSGQAEQALQEHRVVLEIRLKIFGSRHDKTLDSYYHIGMICSRTAEYKEAEENLQHCLRGRSSYYETRIARVLFCMSQVLRDQGREAEADAYLLEARELRKDLIPKDCPGIDPTADEAVLFDQMTIQWAGRTYGRLYHGK